MVLARSSLGVQTRRAVSSILGQAETLPERSRASRILTALACRLQLFVFELERVRQDHLGVGIEALLKRLQEHCQLLAVAGKNGGGVQSGYALLSELSGLLEDLSGSASRLSAQLCEEEQQKPALVELQALLANMSRYRSECDEAIVHLESALSELVQVPEAPATPPSGSLLRPCFGPAAAAPAVDAPGTDQASAGAMGLPVAVASATAPPPISPSSELAAAAAAAAAAEAGTGVIPSGGAPAPVDAAVLQRVRQAICQLDLDVEMEEAGKDLDAELLQLREHMRRAAEDGQQQQQEQEEEEQQERHEDLFARQPQQQPGHPPAAERSGLEAPGEGGPSRVLAGALSARHGFAGDFQYGSDGGGGGGGADRASRGVDAPAALVRQGTRRAREELHRSGPASRSGDSGALGHVPVTGDRGSVGTAGTAGGAGGVGRACGSGGRLHLVRRVSRQLAAQQLARLRQQQLHQHELQRQQLLLSGMDEDVMGGAQAGSQGAEVPAGEEGEQPAAQRRRLQAEGPTAGAGDSGDGAAAAVAAVSVAAPAEVDGMVSLAGMAGAALTLRPSPSTPPVQTLAPSALAAGEGHSEVSGGPLPPPPPDQPGVSGLPGGSGAHAQAAVAPATMAPPPPQPAAGHQQSLAADASVAAVRHLNLVTTLAGMWEAGGPAAEPPSAAHGAHAPHLQPHPFPHLQPHLHPHPHPHLPAHARRTPDPRAADGEEELPCRPATAATANGHDDSCSGARVAAPPPLRPPPLPGSAAAPGPQGPSPGPSRCTSPFLLLAMQARAPGKSPPAAPAPGAAVAAAAPPPPLPLPPPLALNRFRDHAAAAEEELPAPPAAADAAATVAAVGGGGGVPACAAVRVGRSSSGGGAAGVDSAGCSPTAAAAGAAAAQRQRFAPAPLPLPDASVHLRAVGLPGGEELPPAWPHWPTQGPLGPPGYGLGPWLGLGDGAAATAAAAAAAVGAQLLDFGPDVPTLDLRRDITSWGACLGRGAFGAVYKALFRNKPVAVKVLHGSALDVTDLRALRTEISLLCRLRHHPNIIKVYGAAAAPPDQVALVTELMDCDLYDYIHRRRQNFVPLDEVLFIAHAIATGLAELHPAIVHRDLKPANVLLRSSAPHQHQGPGGGATAGQQQPQGGQAAGANPTPLDRRLTVKIADFGLARHKRSQYLSSRERQAGTLKYMAPECVTSGGSFGGGGGGGAEGDKGGSKVTEKCDVYSFGVLLYELITGREPWEGCNAWYAFSQVQAGVTLQLPDDPSRCPPRLRHLVQRCWALQHHQRPSSRELVEELDAIMGSQAHEP